MYCASFIWDPGIYDDEFHRLNDSINKIAQSSEGFVGSESWQSADGSRRCVNYYWSDMESLRTFSVHPVHKEAKKQYARWYKGYHIVISEVIRSYGDGKLHHITESKTKRAAVKRSQV